MTYKEVIKNYETFHRLKLLPGIDEERLSKITNVNDYCDSEFQEILELLRFSSGIEVENEFTFDFLELTTKKCSDNFDCANNVVLDAVDLGFDEFGNRWICEIKNGKLGTVLFLCHDPSIIVFEAFSFGEFLMRLLGDDKNYKFGIGKDDGAWYNKGPSNISVENEFVYDLRNGPPGKSVPLYLYYDERGSLSRQGEDLIYKLPKKSRNWWQRIRDNWR